MFTIILISFVFIILEPIFDAVMDTVDHHQSRSIFSNETKWLFRNQKWWNAHQGWKNKYVDYDTDVKEGIEPRRVKWKILGFTFNKPVQLTDSWHFFKMLKIVSQHIAMVFFPSTIVWTIIIGWNWWLFGILTCVVLLITGGTRNKIFRLFYNNIFLR